MSFVFFFFKLTRFEMIVLCTDVSCSKGTRIFIYLLVWRVALLMQFVIYLLSSALYQGNPEQNSCQFQVNLTSTDNQITLPNDLVTSQLLAIWCVRKKQ